jgi:hypothetical protein
MDIDGANRFGQQLFIAELYRRNGQHWQRAATTPRRYSDHITATAPLRRPPTPGPVQLALFETPRDLLAGRRRGQWAPTDPDLAAALHDLAGEHARRYGWSKGNLVSVRFSMRVLAAIQDYPGALIKASTVEQLTQLDLGVRPAVDIVAEAGFLDEDRSPPITRWFAQRTAELPTQMRTELGIWFDVMRHGSATPPRRRPRAPGTIYTQLDFALPALHAWAIGHQSLREISREDFLAVLPARGTPRATLIGGIRSIFRVLKARKLVFTDPTFRVRGAKAETRQPLPVDIDTVRALIASDDPVRAAMACLLTYHALRSGQLATLQLTDVHDGRLHLDDRVVLLAEQVRQKLGAWLDYRHRRYPRTTNPHLFIQYKTAPHTGPVRKWWIGKKLGLSAKSIREDRILDEAHATGGDARRVSDLFGLSVTQAGRYTATVDHPGIAEFEHHHRGT